LRSLGGVAIIAVACLSAALAVVAFLQGGQSLLTIDCTIPMLTLQVGVARLAAPFLALLALLGAATGIWSFERGSAKDSGLIAVFTATMLLVLCAKSVAMFWLAWEAMSVVSAVLVASNHGRRGVRRATLTYVAVSQAGALCILVALSLLASQASSSSFAGIAAARFPGNVRDAAFALAMLGFGSKAGFVPLHFWLPRAHPVAPPNASAMLSGVMLKVAVYGLMLFCLDLAGPPRLLWGVVVLSVGAISAIVGVLYAIVDHDLKRLLAYHSVENIGIIGIGLGLAIVAIAVNLPGLGALALLAALFHSINHGLFKGLLFLGAGTIADMEGTVDLEKLGGLWSRLAWTAPFFLIGCASISALPPFNGFISEWMTFQALIAAQATASPLVICLALMTIAALALTSGLAVACFAKVLGVAFLGRSRRTDSPATVERFGPAAAALAVLALACTALGVAPSLALVPLAGVVAREAGTPLGLSSLPSLSVVLIVVPLLGAIASYVLARYRRPRTVGTWTCGSPVTPSAQYTATAFSKPIRIIFAFFLVPERRRIVEEGSSSWFPRRILYVTGSRYLVDELARRFAAATLSLARRSRILQSGSLRLYLLYAAAALIVTMVFAR
jgi:hydrogenase-4 component B